MSPPDQLSPKGARTRAAVLSAAEALMLEEGYAAVTFRTVAARAGVTAGNVQYYFASIDDLFLGLLRDRTDGIVERIDDAADADQPLRAVWEYANDERGAALLMEFLALANHRKAIREEIGKGGDRVRQAQLAAIAAKWNSYGIDEKAFPPAAAAFLLSAVPRMLQVERSVGTKTGHDEFLGVVQRYLDQLEPVQPGSGGSP